MHEASETELEGKEIEKRCLESSHGGVCSETARKPSVTH
jgi:hypothetical protein